MKVKFVSSAFVVFFVIMFFMCSGVIALESVTSSKAIVMKIDGVVQVKREATSSWNDADLQEVVRPGDVVKTLDKSFAELKLMDGQESRGVITMQPNAELLITSLTKQGLKEDTLLDLLMGEIVVKAEKLDEESSFQVRTPTSVIGIRGTEFKVKITFED